MLRKGIHVAALKSSIPPFPPVFCFLAVCECVRLMNHPLQETERLVSHSFGTGPVLHSQGLFNPWLSLSCQWEHLSYVFFYFFLFSGIHLTGPGNDCVCPSKSSSSVHRTSHSTWLIFTPLCLAVSLPSHDSWKLFWEGFL